MFTMLLDADTDGQVMRAPDISAQSENTREFHPWA